MGQTGFCKNLRFPAVFCENLRFPAIFCELRLRNSIETEILKISIPEGDLEIFQIFLGPYPKNLLRQYSRNNLARQKITSL